MRLLYINPNATVSMTEGIVAAARAACPAVEIIGVTNSDGPPSIEGAEDGERAVPGVLSQVARARADAIVIACFDDTGLAEAQAAARVPVLGIGQASYLMAALMGKRFAVVTSVPAAVPVIEGNIAAAGFSTQCAGVTASGLAVLDIDEGSEAVRVHLAAEILRARDAGGQAVVLGCAGMAPLKADLAARTGVLLIDGVAASAHLARAAAGYLR